MGTSLSSNWGTWNTRRDEERKYRIQKAEWNLVLANTAAPDKHWSKSRQQHWVLCVEANWGPFCSPINFKISAGYITCADIASLPYSYVSFHNHLLSFTYNLYYHTDTPILWSSFRSFPHSHTFLISTGKMHLTRRRVSVWNGSSAMWRKRLGLWERRRLTFFLTIQ